jgi:hypothetical protein
MRKRGQILIVVAILISVTLLLLAVAVDAGRLYIERARMKRAAQAAADAGISVVAEEMVTLAVARQTVMAGTSTPTPPATVTPTPPLGEVQGWLTDEDRATLVSDPIQEKAEAAALAFAHVNGLSISDPDMLEMKVVYPQPGYAPDNPAIRTLRMLMSVRRRATILLAGLLGQDFIDLSVQGLSEVPQR